MAGTATIIGSKGEDVAMQWFRQRGYVVRERNWRSGSYEIDLILERHGVIHFVEVKTRNPRSWTSPLDAIDDKKLRSLSRAARSYVAQYGITQDLQFDLAAVEIHENCNIDIKIYENILEFRW